MKRLAALAVAVALLGICAHLQPAMAQGLRESSQADSAAMADAAAQADSAAQADRAAQGGEITAQGRWGNIPDTLMKGVAVFLFALANACNTLYSSCLAACEGSINGLWNLLDSCGTALLAAAHGLLGVLCGIVHGALWGCVAGCVAGCVLPFVFCTIAPVWNCLCGWWMSCPLSCAGGLCGGALGAAADGLSGGAEGVVQ